MVYGKGFDAGPLEVGAGSPNIWSLFQDLFWSFPLGSRPAFLPSRPYALEAVLLSTGASLYEGLMAGITHHRASYKSTLTPRLSPPGA